MIKITAVQSINESPERAALFGSRILVMFDIDVSGDSYQWKAYVPAGENMQGYLDRIEADIANDIIEKEAEWADSPKEKTIDDGMGNDVVVPIEKDEIVKPDIPDYVEKRKSMYPPVGEYLDAQVKKHSTDPIIQAEGEAQEEAYFQACLDLKEVVFAKTAKVFKKE